MEELLKILAKEDISISVTNEKELELNYDGDYIDETLLQEIRKYKNDLIAYLSKYKKANQHCTIQPVNERTKYRASFGQKRIWLLSQRKEGSAAYNLSNLREIKNCDTLKFKKALEYLIERHESLRTVFNLGEDGHLYQHIQEPNEIKSFFECRDYRDKSEEDIKNEIREYAKVPFDLTTGPLFKVYLFQKNSEDYIMYYNMHHIISDGWSLDVVINDMMIFYKSLLKEEKVQVESLSIQYKDFASWQLESFENGSLNKERAYWLESLKGNIPLLNLSKTKKRPEVKTFNGEKLQTILNIEVTSKIREFIKEHKGSTYSFLLTMWNILLYKYTGKKEFVIGVPVAGRGLEELENQIGFYVNTIPLKNNINSEDSFLETFSRISKRMLEGISNQMCPLDKIIEDLKIPKDISRNPLFDILLTYQSIRKKKIEPDQEIALETIKLDKTTTNAKLDLDIDFLEHQNYITLEVTYNTDICEENFVRELIKRFKKVVDFVLVNNESYIKDIKYLSDGERTFLINKLNQTNENFNLDLTVLDLFKKQVKSNPNAIAIAYNNGTLTFAELDKLSNQLANGLKKEYGVGKLHVIAIYLEQEERSVISLLGILKLGATYVYVAPEMPQERKEFILKDSKAKLVITDVEFKPDINDIHFSGEIFVIDANFESSWDTSIVYSISSKEIPAYLIYTSGSTGTPKGVVVSHGSLVNYLEWARIYYSDNGTVNLSFGLFTSLTFDLTITSLFLPLVSGNTLTIFKAKEGVSTKLEKYINSNIACIKLTPAHIDVLNLIEIPNQSRISVAIVGGDTLKPHHIGILKNINPDIKIYNEYGPTEATVGCVVKEITSQNEKILIGKPVANTQIMILSEDLELMPFGEVGEICIGGVQLAQGYLNKPKLTKEKFVVNPFNINERLYRTGDLGRWLPNENIDFLGRVDHQVKINGHRIETGEIESALLDIYNIQQAVVIAVENSNGTLQLVGYLVSDDEIDQHEIQNVLSKKLPEYMIPKIYVKLEEIPLTHNGKIDRKGLPDPVFDIEYVPPSSQMEKKITELWQENLNIEKIGIHDNFYSLGGDSLKAIRIKIEIYNKFDIDFEIAELFMYTTIKKLSEEIVSRQLKKEETLGEVVDKVTI
ncbi:amino acid adenylation domain-containing protein [Aquimarina sp. MMG015]|uniref:non-ribosomal peptide synthetase n=1 Tax=Aquimarina sp. MMG015 TaxID=2822689 RepID=UPI001B3A583B|nr:non-ribosomal peptide synthetase [Aquimarina sp. MMG015]MBQ4803348.1 amino acid adenylation domain-containing protein [Aquimarina sp. MMG015]